MIPAIGLMIAAYIFTRMLQIIIDKGKETNIIVALCAIITILITLYAAYVLISSGADIASKLRF